MQTVNSIRRYFSDALRFEEFVTDKTGVKTLELIGASFLRHHQAIPSFGYLAVGINNLIVPFVPHNREIIGRSFLRFGASKDAIGSARLICCPGLNAPVCVCVPP